mmetsp:Transcript_14023/g.23230  ORF Transcript_14023/g.23230 Transcript_14023/m.23230 type:complete len:249 (+) Transcript_14023:35-781(+)|eukprot:CAMPEP_0119335338 /NCGR_PEP_ID=MMETSP1333-20130426/89384_1 /TAXON_ID=418940 /ORGANISM="Scyphosphaera apsteinii, Strain RCC1455" /LENGTH=248 /DNA_ID=CAMNT_0007345869 /DNA_START=29 /DNA_END=775 /DNA_ORIENTATION=+
MNSSILAAQLEPRAVFPGEQIARVCDFEKVVLGDGIVRDDQILRATCIGVLQWDANASRLWIAGERKRYVPVQGDHVIGVVTNAQVEEYRLEIGAAAKAMLPVLAFDGATKRNRPHLQVGTLVYARVTLANKDMEPEVSCAAPPGVSAKDWVTRESIFGELTGGHVFDCPAALCLELSGPNCAVLQRIGDVAPFELAVSANNRVWLNAEKPAVIILAQQAILRSYAHPELDPLGLVKNLAETLDIQGS